MTALPGALYRGWCAHRGGALAAELCLFGLLSVLPVLLCLAALLPSLERLVGAEISTDIRSFTEQQLQRVLGGDSPVYGVVDDLFTGSGRGALTVGLLFAFYAANRGFISLVGSLDVVYAGIGGNGTHARGWVAQRVVGVIAGSVSLIALPAAIVATQASHAIAGRATDNSFVQTIVQTGISAGGYLLGVCWLATLYRYAPRSRLSWRSQFIGAGVAAVAVDAITRVVRAWIVWFGANPLFGALGAVISVVWWLYFVCCAVIFGMVVAAHTERRRDLYGPVLPVQCSGSPDPHAAE